MICACRVFSLFIFHFSLFIFLVSCNPTKHISQGEYLLDSYEINIDNRGISREQMRPLVRQKPNKRIVGARFHLWLYNSSNLEKTNKWNEWLRKNGEEPVVWQQTMTDVSVTQLENFLENKGYYYPVVTDTVILRRKKAEVIYNIKTGWPYTVNKVTYSIPDTAIARLILADTTQSLIKRGMPFDHDVLRQERKRIETNLKNRGYFSFAEDYIEFNADSSNLNRRINLELTVRPHTERAEDNQVVEAPYPVYYIRSLTVNASLSMENLIESVNMQRTASDTLQHGVVNFIIPQRFPVKASAIRNAVFISPDSLYRISDVNQTHQHLNGLRNFRQINPEFSEVPGQAGLTVRELDCMISLLPFTRQNYSVDLEGTNTDGNLGGGLRLEYQNRSLFGHAEFFNLKLRGMAEAVPKDAKEQSVLGRFGAKMEYEAEASINIPKLLLPISLDRFTQRYNPQTTFSVSYNHQQYPNFYVRTMFNASFGYNWRGSDVVSHFVKPLDVNFVQLPYVSGDFQNTLNRFPVLKNSYQSHMVVSSNYTFVRDMRMSSRTNFFFVRTHIETAGLLLDAVYRMSGQSKQPGEAYRMFNNEFSQFIKGDVDLRYYYSINRDNRMVARVFSGVGLPYGNSKTTVTNSEGVSKTVAAMPFEKKYYAGGANSIRGWRLRSLGPGSYKDSAAFTRYPNNSGDIKLEANLEYRFKLVWLIEGALFLDAGNVWDTHKDDDRPGASFSFDRFYREIALSGGLGLRFDFKFFILRADLGKKLHDPAGDGRWAFTRKPEGGSRVSRNDFCMSIAIGYPFF